MGFFGKTKDDKKEGKKSQSPSLPNLPELPNSTEKKNSIAEPPKNPTLPAFPGSSLGNKMNQNSIKEAISKSEEEDKDERITPNIPPMSSPPRPGARGMSKPRSIEMAGPTGRPTMAPISPPPSRKNTATTPSVEQISPRTSGEPLFIKLDTFEKSISSFNEIKLRVGEIETLLANIKSIKEQEERELIDWEAEINSVKSRLEEIDREIFSKI